MPRPVKCRKVCHFPQTREFCPAQGCNGKSPVILTVDEYETIRLIDKEGMSQAECSEFMQVARTTVAASLRERPKKACGRHCRRALSADRGRRFLAVRGKRPGVRPLPSKRDENCTR